LAEAAVELAENARCVAILTGFFIPHAEIPAAETDGPLGSLTLAAILRELGVEVTVITDGHCFPAVAAVAEFLRFPTEQLERLDFTEDSAFDEYVANGRVAQFSHLIAIERVGPSHTADSLNAQTRYEESPVTEFEQQTPHEYRNRCYNMRGEAIDAVSGNLHRIFEHVAASHPEIRTIGIGDGANEIGMGSIPWENLRRRLTGDHAGWIPCRVTTDWTIVAGTSNWGGYALAAAVAHLRQSAELFRPFDAAHQERLLQHMIEYGPAVDGVTRRREPTVDGLPFLTYIQPLDRIRELLGFD